MLLAGRVRKADECDVIVQVLEKHLKRKVVPQQLFSLHEQTSPTTRRILQALVQNTCQGQSLAPCFMFTLLTRTYSVHCVVIVTWLACVPGFEHVVWTFGMRRMAVLVAQALRFGEPVLLVGETG